MADHAAEKKEAIGDDGCQPKGSPDKEAEDADQSEGHVGDPDFILERAPGRPADHLRRCRAVENMKGTGGQAPQAEGYDQQVEQDDLDDLFRGPFFHEQEMDNDGDQCDAQQKNGHSKHPLLAAILRYLPEFAISYLLAAILLSLFFQILVKEPDGALHEERPERAEFMMFARVFIIDDAFSLCL